MTFFQLRQALAPVRTWIAIGFVGVAAALACAPSVEERAAEAQELLNEGHTYEAVKRLRALTDEHPGDPDLNLMYGGALLATGSASLAIWPLRKASQAPERALEGSLLLGAAHLQSGNPNDAISAADRALELDPGHLDGLFLRATARLEAHRAEEALEDLGRIRELDSDTPRLALLRLTALLSLKRIEEAAEALTTAKALISERPDEISADMPVRLCAAGARFLFEKGEPKSAEEAYAACLEEYPGHPIVVGDAVKFYGETERHERANEILYEALEAAPAQSFARNTLALRLEGMGEPEEAERLLREAAEQFPSVDTWSVLADLYVHRDDFEASRVAWEHALELAENPPSMLQFAYGDTLVQLGAYQDAQSVIDALAPPYGELLLGRMLLDQDRPREALEALEAGVVRWPDNPTARWLAARAAEQLGDFERAISEYKESVRSEAAATDAGLRLARLYSLMGQNMLALDAIGHHHRSHPKDAEALVVSIEVAAQLGRNDLVTGGLQRLAQLPGQTARAVGHGAVIRAESLGLEAGIGLIESVELDLTDPRHIEALRALVQLLEADGRRAAALARAEAALAAHPDQAPFHALRGELLRSAGRSDEARVAFQAALELDPDHAPALVGLAEIARESGDTREAIALYDRAAAADTEQPGPGFAAAELLRESGRSEEAEERLRSLLHDHPLHGPSAYALTRLLMDRGAFDAAEPWAERAVALRANPEAPETLERVQLRNSS